MSLVGLLGLLLAAVIVAALVAFYAWVYRRNRAQGGGGFVSRSRLTCPQCHQTFDYDYVPGASLTALRLGRARYMRCPLCHRWGVFDLASTRRPIPPPGTP